MTAPRGELLLLVIGGRDGIKAIGGAPEILKMSSRHFDGALWTSLVE